MPYSTDTRTLQPGDTYVAVVGETHDGHDFVAQAVEAGAHAVVVEQDVTVPEHVEVRVVESTVGWLLEAEASAKRCESWAALRSPSRARWGRRRRGRPSRACSASRATCSASTGNKNTPLGLSLLLLNAELTPQTVLVLEMGARLEGDIRELCEAFPPTVGVVTNVRGGPRRDAGEHRRGGARKVRDRARAAGRRHGRAQRRRPAHAPNGRRDRRGRGPVRDRADHCDVTPGPGHGRPAHPGRPRHLHGHAGDGRRPRDGAGRRRDHSWPGSHRARKGTPADARRDQRAARSSTTPTTRRPTPPAPPST